MFFQPFDPTGMGRKKRRLAELPLLALIPSMITLSALAMGMSAMRMALEDRYELALIFIVIAAILDGIDGRVARLLKRTSRFGAELDSLADVVNFGVVPAMVLYSWGLSELGNFGWMMVLIYAGCAMLRLARFNVELSDTSKPAWTADYFVGVPSPLAAFLVCLPIYVELAGLKLPEHPLVMISVSFYVFCIGLLMVSTLPAYSGKARKIRIGRRSVIAFLLLLALSLWLLASYPWPMAAILAVAYLAALPYWQHSYRQLERKHQAEQAQAKPKDQDKT